MGDSATVNWAENNNALTWHLIGLVEHKDNRKVIVGKAKKEVETCSIDIYLG